MRNQNSHSLSVRFAIPMCELCNPYVLIGHIDLGLWNCSLRLTNVVIYFRLIY